MAYQLKKVTSKVEVVGGFNMDVEGISDLLCLLRGKFYLLCNVCCMSKNSESLLGITALKKMMISQALCMMSDCPSR